MPQSGAGPAMFPHGGIGVICGNENIRIGLIIPQQNVIAGFEFFNQIAFQQQGLLLAVGHNKHHGPRQGHHALQANRQSLGPRIGHNPFFQGLGLAHIQDRFILRQHPVNPRGLGQGRHLMFNDGNTGF